MVTLCQVNYKGGVGKTTNTVHVGAEIASRGSRVLLIDADPQCDLSFATGCTASNYNLLDFINKKPGFRLKQKSQNFFILPGSEQYNASDFKRDALKKAIETKCQGENGESFYLKDHFDYILIDVHPDKIDNNYTTTTELALIACDYFITCTYAEPLSVKNLNTFISKVLELKNNYNKKLKYAGLYFGNVLVTRKSTANIMDKIRASADGLDYQTFIRQDSEIVNACEVGKTIFQYKPSSRAAEDYVNLTDEILKSIQ